MAGQMTAMKGESAGKRKKLVKAIRNRRRPNKTRTSY